MSEPQAILAVEGFHEGPQGLALIVQREHIRVAVGAPILAIFGDLGPQPEASALALPSVHARDLRRRVMKAVFPVVDLIFPGGAHPPLRLAAGALPWRGLAGAGLSSSLNLVSLLDRLALDPGLQLDLEFTGIGPIEGPPGPRHERADPQRSQIFDGYVRARAAASRLATLSPERPPIEATVKGRAAAEALARLVAARASDLDSGRPLRARGLRLALVAAGALLLAWGLTRLLRGS